MGVLEQLHEVGGCSGLEPVVSEFHLSEGIQQAEWIVYTLGLGGEMVSVIALLEFQAGFLVGRHLGISQFLHFVIQIGMYLFFCDAAYLDVPIIHRQVHEVVEVAEYAYLAELGHAGQERQADIPVHALQNAVKRFQYRAVGLL